MMMSDSEPIFQRNLKRVQTAPKNSEFSVVSYNILCDAVFENNPALYSYLPNEMKCRGPLPKNSVRHIQLMKELSWLDADVVCLQEVDPFYFPHLVQELATLGYDGNFQAHVPGSDGVATFYKPDKFQLKNYEIFGFNEQLGEAVELDKFENSNEHNQRLAQYTCLKDLKSEKEIVIVNLHLIFNFWREPDMHAAQAAIFFQQLYNVLPQSAKHSTAWIVCGDFNMIPHFPAYELVKNGNLPEYRVEKLRPGKYEYPNLTESRKEMAKSERNGVVHEELMKIFSHPLKYSNSAYKSVLGCEPKFTHYECDDVFPEVFGFDMMKDTLDYIWFSSDLLQANAVLEMVDEEHIKPFLACPNKYFPSDHLPLKACFQFMDNVDSAYSSE